MTGPGNGCESYADEIPNPKLNYPRTIYPVKCKRCFRLLPAIEFNSCPRKFNGLYTRCKLCTIIVAKDCHPPPDRTQQARTNEDAWCQKCHRKFPAHNFNYTCNDCLPVYERTVVDTRCTKCETTKPASEFSTENRAKNGIFKRCKGCVKANKSLWLKANKSLWLKNNR